MPVQKNALSPFLPANFILIRICPNNGNRQLFSEIFKELKNNQAKNAYCHTPLPLKEEIMTI